MDPLGIFSGPVGIEAKSAKSSKKSRSHAYPIISSPIGGFQWIHTTFRLHRHLLLGYLMPLLLPNSSLDGLTSLGYSKHFTPRCRFSFYAAASIALSFATNFSSLFKAAWDPLACSTLPLSPRRNLSGPKWSLPRELDNLQGIYHIIQIFSRNT